MIYTFSHFGYEGNLINVESDLRRGIPTVDIIGLSDSLIKETREIVRSAIKNSGLDFPGERILIALSPCDVKKDGLQFTLPIALSILESRNELMEDDKKETVSDKIFVMGTLDITGSVDITGGIYSAVLKALEEGFEYFILPEKARYELKNIQKGNFFFCSNLSEAEKALYDKSLYSEFIEDEIEEKTVEIEGILFPYIENRFMTMKVSKAVKELLDKIVYAVAGKHSVLAVGKVGSGKTPAMLYAEKLLPFLSKEESEIVRRIYSISGLPFKTQYINTPFRKPHSTASIEGMCGGGINCNPGEITLSHKGILFLDEAAEFRSSVLQMLRVPLESKSITLSRAGRTTVYPANFSLFMTSNPCPCGNYGSKDRCLCSSRSIELYWNKFSAPLLDRISIQHFQSEETDEVEVNFHEYRKIIARAFAIQRKRGVYNNDLLPVEIADICHLDDESEALYTQWTEKENPSTRRAQNLLKLARTVADVEQNENIKKEHLEKAIVLMGKDFTKGIL